ncbi:MAG: hypothetical protein BZY81_01020 [SAR202 cluster bacterium Io17-Chloro-G4]|nr:MAG: hypothetical protein BZY81_01020 [SAR202 cluster bacterium Io17-Chloro-G4]
METDIRPQPGIATTSAMGRLGLIKIPACTPWPKGCLGGFSVVAARQSGSIKSLSTKAALCWEFG